MTGNKQPQTEKTRPIVSKQARQLLIVVEADETFPSSRATIIFKNTALVIGNPGATNMIQLFKGIKEEDVNT